jgi:Tol biopolymer transport system component
VLAAPVGTLANRDGLTKNLTARASVERFEANFFPDGRRIVFGGREKDREPRIYVQDVQTGMVRAISSDDSGTVGVSSQDGRFVIGQTGANRFLFPVDGGAPVPFRIMAPDDVPL